MDSIGAFGSTSRQFSGNFDGAGYSISGTPHNKGYREYAVSLDVEMEPPFKILVSKEI